MDHKKLIMYAHGSAYNHGCEAIVRSTTKLLDLEKNGTILFSNNSKGDYEFGLDKIAMVHQVEETPVEHDSALGYLYRIRAHMHKNHTQLYYRYFGEKQYRYLFGHSDVALSIGGDNYCYSSALTGLEVRNYWLNKTGTKTILWGASLSEELLNQQVKEDIERYSLIVVRENLSYEMLKSNSIRTNILLAPDPAFSLVPQDTVWPDGCGHHNIVGINISHFVTNHPVSGKIGMRNYVNLINWILNETDMEIALIPHVVYPEDPGNNDLLDINKLLEYIPEREKIIVVGEGYNCCQLKSLISKCRFFVGARTHATIAAYSAGVPTLVVGYSTKSIGIARDLFGSDDGYVCSVQNMMEEHILENSFRKIVIKEGEIRRHLRTIMPVYLKGYSSCIDAVNTFIR